MPACTRINIDNSAGHDGFEPRPIDDAKQTSVYINDLLAAIVGSHYAQHCDEDCHDGVASTGSSTVFIAGKAIHRIGDNISCGDMSAAGSRNVFAG